MPSRHNTQTSDTATLHVLVLPRVWWVVPGWCPDLVPRSPAGPEQSGGVWCVVVTFGQLGMFKPRRWIIKKISHNFWTLPCSHFVTSKEILLKDWLTFSCYWTWDITPRPESNLWMWAAPGQQTDLYWIKENLFLSYTYPNDKNEKNTDKDNKYSSNKKVWLFSKTLVF